MEKESICQPVAAETAKIETARPQQAATARPSSPFTDFAGLVRHLPAYGPRTLRALVKRRVIPCVRPPGTRKLNFHLPSVEAALLRYQQGGPDNLLSIPLK